LDHNLKSEMLILKVIESFSRNSILADEIKDKIQISEINLGVLKFWSLY
jgi:hypothetical protein